MTRLELLFTQQGEKTILSEQFSQSPLKVLRPFELEPGSVLLQLLNVGPGIMAGDLFDLHIRVAEGAKVVLLNQSASKLHSMPEGRSACQIVHIEVESGGELEYYPGLSIPFKDAEFKNRVAVELAEGANFAMLESWAMGRIAFDERFMFRKLSSHVKVRQGGKLVYADALELDPKAKRLGISDGHAYLASGIWVWPDLPEPMLNTPISSICKTDESLIYEAFAPDKLYFRGVSSDSLSLSKKLNGFINDWRVQRGKARLEFERYRS